MKKGLAIWGIKKREGWKIESGEEKRERRFRGVWYPCFFSFLSKGVPREKTVTRERGFFL